MGCWLSWWYFLILYKYSQMLKNNEGKELQKKKKSLKGIKVFIWCKQLLNINDM